MDNRSEVREFLTSRRAKITPQQAGRPAAGHRRVKGLRREEVAMLAGVSAEYYARMERGNLSGTSEAVLDSLARALQLDESERAHLMDLARTAGTTRRPARRRTAQPIRPRRSTWPATSFSTPAPRSTCPNWSSKGRGRSSPAHRGRAGSVQP
ncbi:hypothetical protein GCM10010424_53550 [Streptomyces lienomycini]